MDFKAAEVSTTPLVSFTWAYQGLAAAPERPCSNVFAGVVVHGLRVDAFEVVPPNFISVESRETVLPCFTFCRSEGLPRPETDIRRWAVAFNLRFQVGREALNAGLAFRGGGRCQRRQDADADDRHHGRQQGEHSYSHVPSPLHAAAHSNGTAYLYCRGALLWEHPGPCRARGQKCLPFVSAPIRMRLSVGPHFTSCCRGTPTPGPANLGGVVSQTSERMGNL
jgi:hypothetical protein